MPKTVTARFEREEDAELALSAIAAEVPLRDSAVVSSGLAGSLTLDSLHLTPEERSGCEQQMSKGGFLLVAQVASESRGEDVLRLLDSIGRKGEATGAAPPPAEHHGAMPTPEHAAGRPEPLEGAVGPAREETMEEERIPLIEEELRIGKREVVKSRSRVHTYVAEVPVEEQVELVHEETHLERRPVNRRLTEEELVQGGLLQERVIEIAEMREEPVVTKEAFVREELVVRKSMHRRVEQIRETVRRTQVETERLQPEQGVGSETTRESGEQGTVGNSGAS